MLALRFARVKGYREDKSAAEADTIDTVRDIYLRSLGELPARGGELLSMFTPYPRARRSPWNRRRRRRR